VRSSLLLGLVFLAAGCGFTTSSSKTETVTVTQTVTHTVTAPGDSGGGTTTTASGPSACSADDLKATFQVLQGSAGAGNIVYTLHVTNTSSSACTISGIPTTQLLDANGGQLETHGTPNGAATAVLVTLQPGDSASAQARFSPDVDPCGTIYATTLRFSPAGGGTLDVRVDPRTRVCNHGAMQWDPFTTNS
jgi:hypothetical protein